MTDVNIVLSGNRFIEFLKNLENGGLGEDYVFHDKQKLHGGVFPYGYRNTVHSWVTDAWRDEWADRIMPDETKAYDETEGWSDEVSEDMFEELINIYLVPEIQKLANGTFTNSDITLTDSQWDAVASIAWNVGTNRLKPLFELL